MLVASVVLGACFAATSAAAASGTAACPVPAVRREWRELSSSDQKTFLNAVVCLKKSRSVLPASIRSPSRFDDFAFVHLQGTLPQNSVHGNPLFIVWHRLFINMFETALNSCGWHGTMPYWDWSADSQAPEQSPLLTASAFGGNGNSSLNGCITDGLFKSGFATTFDTKAPCISRNFQFVRKASGTFFSPETVFNIMSANPSYQLFTSQLEFTPHAAIHTGLGGDMFRLQTSAN
eukprot:jgi/Hompol1/4387/HPOL_007076-RA